MDIDLFYEKTSHPKVFHDNLIETFVVIIDKESWCEVYGINQFENAIKIAEALNNE